MPQYNLKHFHTKTFYRTVSGGLRPSTVDDYNCDSTTPSIVDYATPFRQLRLT